MNATACIAVDWGTSRMRLWQIAPDGSIIAKRHSDEGLEGARDAGFGAILDKHLNELRVADDVPVIICGMAGSRQGWLEAPYAPVPGSLNTIIGQSVKIPDSSRTVHILPGMSQAKAGEANVMRGEETQLLGLDSFDGKQLVVMPGTHSKWVELDGRTVTHFVTYLTGETFALFSKQSILRHSLGQDANFDAKTPAFLAAVKAMCEAPQHLSRDLFSIRAASLVNGTSANESEATLSGLLIGAEIGSARLTYGTKSSVTLVGTGHLGNLYSAALSQAGFRFVLADGEALVLSGLTQAAKTLWPTRFSAGK